MIKDRKFYIFLVSSEIKMAFDKMRKQLYKSGYSQPPLSFRIQPYLNVIDVPQSLRIGCTLVEPLESFFSHLWGSKVHLWVSNLSRTITIKWHEDGVPKSPHKDQLFDTTGGRYHEKPPKYGNLSMWVAGRPVKTSRSVGKEPETA